MTRTIPQAAPIAAVIRNRDWIRPASRILLTFVLLSAMTQTGLDANVLVDRLSRPETKGVPNR